LYPHLRKGIAEARTESEDLHIYIDTSVLVIEKKIKLIQVNLIP
jgi:hypothetical protein